MQKFTWYDFANPIGKLRRGHLAGALQSGECSPNPIAFNSHGQQTTKYRTCFVLPPEGKLNALGESRNVALERCQWRCQSFGTLCSGVNVVPLQAPPQVKFRAAQNCELAKDNADGKGVRSTCVGAISGGRPIPFGVSNCDSKCFAKEPHPADSMVCYPVKLGVFRLVEEPWTVAVDDDQDEAWYSTCFSKDRVREFKGITTCMEYIPPGSKEPMCGALRNQVKWRHGAGCISCSAVKSNEANTTLIPAWSPLPPNQCSMCDLTELTAEYTERENAAAVETAAAEEAAEKNKERAATQTALAVLALLGVNGVLLLLIAAAAAAVATILVRSRRRFQTMDPVDRAAAIKEKQQVLRKRRFPVRGVAVGANASPALPPRTPRAEIYSLDLVEPSDEDERQSDSEARRASSVTKANPLRSGVVPAVAFGVTSSHEL